MTTNRPEANDAAAYSEGATMTDKTIPAGLTRDEARAVREWAERARAAEVQDDTVVHAARVLLAVLPKPPTLEDMTPEDRRECKWMQADVDGWDERAVILAPYTIGGLAVMLDQSGDVSYKAPALVTPRDDLPRFDWPHTYQEAKDATPAKIGDVIESADDPRLDTLPLGTVLLDRDNDAVTKRGDTWHGLGYYPTPGEGAEFGPWTVATIPDHNPEPAPDFTLAPGSMWGDGAHLENHLDQSPYTRAVVIDRDNDLAIWSDGYWEGAGFQPGSRPGEGPWRIIWVGTDQGGEQ